MVEKKTSGETENQDRTKSNRIVQNGIVKPEDLGKIADAFIEYKFPEDAVQTAQSSSMKREISGYRSQYIVNALNEIIGPGNWREYGTDETTKPATAFVSIYRGTFEIGNWKNQIISREIVYPDGRIIKENDIKPYFNVLAQYHQTGGSRNMDQWEAIKGARTNFLKKVASYISCGWRSYALVIDEDFNSAPPEIEKPLPAPRPQAPRTAGEQPNKPATANATLISTQEHQRILELYGQLGYTQEEVPERIKALETRFGKTIAEFTQGEARDTIKKMEAQTKKMIQPTAPEKTYQEKVQETLEEKRQKELASKTEAPLAYNDE
jgi:hypothetical protein